MTSVVDLFADGAFSATKAAFKAGSGVVSKVIETVMPKGPQTSPKQLTPPPVNDPALSDMAPPKVTSKKARDAGNLAAAAAEARKGFLSTILTNPAGILSPALTGRKTLLGA